MAKRIFLIIFICASFFLVAQEPVSIQLSEKNGLPDKEFYDVIEDDNGFIWFAGDKGLFRFDGEVYEPFSCSKQRGLSVFGLQKDSENRIWCNNISGQFFYTKDNGLELFFDLSKALLGELASFVVTEEFLWVFSFKHIYKIDLETKKIDEVYTSRQGFGEPYSLNKEQLLFSNGTSIETINALGEKSIVIPENNLFKNSQGKVEFFKYKEELFVKQVLLNGKNIVYKFNYEAQKLNRTDELEDLGSLRVQDEFFINNELWIATNSGVFVYENIDNSLELKRYFLSHLNVTKIYKDKHSNTWLTTLNNGIVMIPNIFIETYNISKKQRDILSLDKINDSTIVFGSSRGDVTIYNLKNNKEQVISFPKTNRVSMVKYDSVFDRVFVSKDLDGHIIDVTNYNTRSISFFQAIKSMVFTKRHDLFYTDYKKTRIAKQSNLDAPPILISGNRRTYDSYYKISNQSTYVAYVDNIIRYDSLWKPHKVTFNQQPIFGKSISETKNGVVWIGSFKDGVFGIKNDTVAFHLSTKNGLTSNRISKIKGDDNQLWIVSENSIQLFNVKTNEMQIVTQNDGVLSYHVTGIELFDDRAIFSSNKGLFSIQKDKAFKEKLANVYFKNVKINDRDTTITSYYKLRHNQNDITIGFNVNSFLFHQRGRYRYRLKGYNNQWMLSDINESSISYKSLPYGKYRFQVQPVFENQTKSYEVEELYFNIPKPYWETWWFKVLLIVITLGTVVFYYKRKMKTREIEKEALLQKISLEKELISTNLIALRSQMNPHFIFNALNSIQDLVLKQDTNASYDYIVLFSNLIRNTLSYSNQDFITLEKEIDFLDVYLKLEKLRFGNDLHYSITSNVDYSIKIPSLLIQPFIENALVHGLLHKKGIKTLDISFSFENRKLQCVIIDNGIGRKKANEILQRQGNIHESFALIAIKRRLDIFNKQHEMQVGYIIIDLYNDDKAIGTKVEITMPFTDDH